MNFSVESLFAYVFPAVNWMLTISITIRLMVKKQAVSATLSWLMVIYLIPVIGLIAYLIFGEIKLGTKHAAAFRRLRPKFVWKFQEFAQCRHLVLPHNSLQYRALFQLIRNRLSIPCIPGNQLQLLSQSDSIIRHIIQDIHQAKDSINMVFYIWESGGLVNELQQALKEAVNRRVCVRILLDSVGSRHFLKSKARLEMKEAGIQIVETLHVNLLRMFFSRIDLRQHRKIIVIDNQIAYTGSMNMVDPKIFKQHRGIGEWIDIMVRINGPVSPVLNILHAWDWEIETGKTLSVNLPSCPTTPLDTQDLHAVQVLATGPGFPDDLIAQSLLLAIFSAKESITITSPYFVPSHNVAEALRIAALRGIEVNLIVPKKSDSIMVRWASRTFFDDLLAANVKIYAFEQGLLHTKSVLIDNRLTMVGTVNMDLRSFLLNFEVTMVVEDRDFAKKIHQLQQHYIENSALINYEEWKNRSVVQRMLERLFFLFSPLL